AGSQAGSHSGVVAPIPMPGPHAKVRSMRNLLPLLALAATAAPTSQELQRMINRFAPTQLIVDTTTLPSGDRKALMKLIETARVINDIFLQQMWSGNRDVYAGL